MTSIEFINDQINKKLVEKDFPTTGWDTDNENVMVSDLFENLPFVLTKAEYDAFIKGKKIENFLFKEKTNEKRKVKAKKNNNFDYNYFLTKEVTITNPDDALMEVNSMVRDVFFEMMGGTTYFMPTAPQDYVDNHMAYDLEYTYGDLVLRMEEVVSENKKTTNKNENNNSMTFYKLRLMVILPIAIKYSKHKNIKEENKNE